LKVWIPVAIGYLAGSVPFAFLIARRRGIDVRAAGSGNVGTANVLRTTGTGPALAVMAMDIGKGALPVATTLWCCGDASAAALAGLAAVVGHVYPVWLRFHGGKGVAVAAGVFAVLAPVAAAGAAALFVPTLLITRYVSLGSIAAAVALPHIAWATGSSSAVVWAAAATAALILFRHRANLRRLRAGTEPRMTIPRASSSHAR
jgi:glycerol-3-phosphate acyltransferase PlsY